jgi:hypothetical protein
MVHICRNKDYYSFIEVFFKKKKIEINKILFKIDVTRKLNRLVIISIEKKKRC